MIQDYLALAIFIAATAVAVFSVVRFIVNQLKSRQPECGSNCGCKTSGKMIRVHGRAENGSTSGLLNGLKLK